MSNLKAKPIESIDEARSSDESETDLEYSAAYLQAESKCEEKKQQVNKTYGRPMKPVAEARTSVEESV